MIMSVGLGGYADLVAADNTLVIYKYCCYNVNNAEYKQFMEMEDGEMNIDRGAFVEPEIHVRIRKSPSGGKRLVSKRIVQDVPIEAMIEAGKIKVMNASGTWRTTESGVDIMALKLLFKLFNEYQETGEIPGHLSWFS